MHQPTEVDSVGFGCYLREHAREQGQKALHWHSPHWPSFYTFNWCEQWTLNAPCPLGPSGQRRPSEEMTFKFELESQLPSRPCRITN